MSVLLGNDGTAVWVKMPARRLGGREISPEWELEATAWYDEEHPSGRTNLVRVSYMYLKFDGWVRRNRLRPRS